MTSTRSVQFVSAGLIGLVIALTTGLSLPKPAQAATTFLIRGDVTKYDKSNGNFHVYIRHANSAAEKFAGEIHEINASSAVFYKYDSKQKKVRSTFGTTINNSGIEVVVKGTVDNSNVFKATWVVRNDTTVKIRGYVRGQSVADNYLTVELDKVLFVSTGKTYNATTFPAGASVRIYYGDNTKFISRDGNSINEDQISNNDEKVTLENIEVVSGSRLQSDANTKITDGKWLF